MIKKNCPMSHCEKHCLIATIYLIIIVAMLHYIAIYLVSHRDITKLRFHILFLWVYNIYLRVFIPWIYNINPLGLYYQSVGFLIRWVFSINPLGLLFLWVYNINPFMVYIHCINNINPLGLIISLGFIIPLGAIMVNQGHIATKTISWSNVILSQRWSSMINHGPVLHCDKYFLNIEIIHGQRWLAVV